MLDANSVKAILPSKIGREGKTGYPEKKYSKRERDRAVKLAKDSSSFNASAILKINKYRIDRWLAEEGKNERL